MPGFAVGVARFTLVWRLGWRITILRYSRLRQHHFIADCLQAEKRWSLEHYRSNTARPVIVISLERHCLHLISNNAIIDEIYSFLPISHRGSTINASFPPPCRILLVLNRFSTFRFDFFFLFLLLFLFCFPLWLGDSGFWLNDDTFNSFSSSRLRMGGGERNNRQRNLNHWNQHSVSR